MAWQNVVDFEVPVATVEMCGVAFRAAEKYVF